MTGKFFDLFTGKRGPLFGAFILLMISQIVFRENLYARQLRFNPDHIGAELEEPLFFFKQDPNNPLFFHLGGVNFDFSDFGRPSQRIGKKILQFKTRKNMVQWEKIFLFGGDQTIFESRFDNGISLVIDGKGKVKEADKLENLGGDWQAFEISDLDNGLKFYSAIKICVSKNEGINLIMACYHFPETSVKPVRQMLINDAKVGLKGAFIASKSKEIRIDYFYNQFSFLGKFDVSLQAPKIIEVVQKDQDWLELLYQGNPPRKFSEVYSSRVVSPYVFTDGSGVSLIEGYLVDVPIGLGFLNVEIFSGVTLSYLIKSQKAIPPKNLRPKLNEPVLGSYRSSIALKLQPPEGIACTLLISNEDRVDPKDCIWFAGLREKGSLNYPSLELRDKETYVLDYALFYAPNIYGSIRTGGSAFSQGIALSLDHELKYLSHSSNPSSLLNHFMGIVHGFQQETLVSFLGSQERLKLQRNTIDLLYAPHRRIFGYEFFYGLGLSYSMLNVSLDQQVSTSHLGVTGFLSMPPPEILRDVLNVIPFMKRSKWGELHVSYSPGTGGGLFLIKGVGRFDLTKNFFWELGWVLEAFNIVIQEETKISFLGGRTFLGFGGRF